VTPDGPLRFVCDDMRHLICEPYSIENLHRMARELGIGAWWFHQGRFPHYDIPKRRIEQITAKCVLVDPREIVRIICEARGSFAEGHLPER